MNRKAIFALGAVLFLLALALGAWALTMALQQEPPEPETPAVSDPFGGISIPVAPESPKAATIADREGNAVPVPDFTGGLDPLQGTDGTYYLLHGPEYSAEGFTFSAQYGERDSSFLVTLLSEPLSSARADAERFLRDELELSDAALCALNTRVVAPADVNEAYAAHGDLGLSFCPGAVPLP